MKAVETSVSWVNAIKIKGHLKSFHVKPKKCFIIISPITTVNLSPKHHVFLYLNQCQSQKIHSFHSCMNQQMHIQLHSSFITNTYIFRSPSETTFRRSSKNTSSKIQAVYGETLQVLVYCTNSIKFLRSSSNHDKNLKILLWV